MGRIGVVHPEKKRAIEERLIMMAQKGALAGEVTEDQIVDFLEQMSAATKSTTVKVS